MRRESLRARTFALYATVVTLVVALSGPTVCYVYWRTLLTRMDDELHARAMTVLQSLQPVGNDAFDLNLPDDAREYFTNEPYYGVWAADRRVIDISNPGQVPDRPDTDGPRTHNGRREAVVRSADGVTVLVGRDMAGVRAAVRSLAVTTAGVGLTAAALSILCAWLLAGRALAPIDRISRTARAMAEGDLAARIPIEGTETELEQVALALNSAFDRMHAALEQFRRFTADASHELRTPVATLSAETEWALGRPRDADAYRGSLLTCRTATLRIGSIVRGLLLLARTDAGESPLAPGAIRADHLVEEVIQLTRPIAAQRNVDIHTSVAAVEIQADLERLREAISNLVVNAIHFNKQGGSVTVAGNAEADFVFRVRDTGIGIAAEHLPHICDRFYRVPPTRGTRQGAGLGLAITRAIVEQHGGTLRCYSDLARGSEFVVELPLTAVT